MQNQDKPFGVPHHTDTSVILYNADLLGAAGITDVPTELEDAWTWDEFRELAQALRRHAAGRASTRSSTTGRATASPAGSACCSRPTAASWPTTSITPAIDSDAGRQAVDFTKSFFADKLVPPNSSVKSTTYAADIWYSQTAAMTFGGAFLIPDADQHARLRVGGHLRPAQGPLGQRLRRQRPGRHRRDHEARAGGHVPRLRHRPPSRCATSAPPPRCCRPGPTWSSRGIDFAVRPELSPVFVGQAGAVQAQDSGQVASPSMSQDHHRAQGSARGGLRRRSEHRDDAGRSELGHRRRDRRMTSAA